MAALSSASNLGVPKPVAGSHPAEQLNPYLKKSKITNQLDRIARLNVSTGKVQEFTAAEGCRQGIGKHRGEAMTYGSGCPPRPTLFEPTVTSKNASSFW
jgi:hypothetical protein